jgi:PHD/YefM family antitoxin component YafN of YafNO toxin-antitoxin module
MIQLQNVLTSDFHRHTSRHISSLRKSGLPEVLTLNGKAELVVQSAEAYQAILDRLELMESAREINRRLQSVRDGKVPKFSTFAKEFRAELSASITRVRSDGEPPQDRYFGGCRTRHPRISGVDC